MFHRGGLETHIHSEVRTLSKLGVDVHMAVGSFAPGSLIPDGISGLLTYLQLGPGTTAEEVLASVDRIVSYLHKHEIGHVHAHPFVSGIIGFLAAGQANAAFAYTLHGPASLSPAYGPIYDVLLRNFVLPGASLVACVSDEVAKLARLASTYSNVAVLENPIGLLQPARLRSRTTTPLPPPKPRGKSRLAFVARLDNDKLNGAQDFFDKLEGPDFAEVHIFGDGQARDRLANHIKERRASARVRFRGWSHDLASELKNFDIVAGMGRVVLEAGALGKPVVLVGYDGVKGFLDEAMFARASLSNFSGRNLPTIKRAALVQQIEMERGEALEAIQSKIRGSFGEDAIWKRFTSLVNDTPSVDRNVTGLLCETIREAITEPTSFLQSETLRRRIADEIRDPQTCHRFATEAAQAEAARERDLRQASEAAQSEALVAAERERAQRASAEDQMQAAQAEAARERDLRQASEAAQSEALVAVERERAQRASAEDQMQAAQAEAARERDLRQASEAAQSEALVAAERERAQRASAEDQMQAAQAEAARERDLRQASEAAQSEALVAVERERAQRASAEDQMQAAQAEAARERDLRQASEAAQSEALVAVERERSQRASAEDQMQVAQADAVAVVERVRMQGASMESKLLAAQDEAYRERAARERLEARGVGALLMIASEERRRRFAAEVARRDADEALAIEIGRQGRDTAELSHTVFSGLRTSQSSTPQPSMTGLVSIILPIYNQANFLPTALRGIIDQTYRGWELIVVNDGSSDDFDSAIRPFLGDHRIRVLYQPNQRLPSALNNGFAVARGEFLTWTSADNEMLPDQLEILLRALRENPLAGLAYSDYQAIDDADQPLQMPEWRAQNRPDRSSLIRLPAEVTVSNFHKSGDNFLGASFLWRAMVHDVVGSHDENLFGGEDYDFWLRMHLVTPFVHVDRITYRYRVHDNTLNARAKELRIFDNVRALLTADVERRQVLLRDPDNLNAGMTFWRPAEQYHAELSHAFDMTTYSRIAADPIMHLSSERVRVVEIDVPLKEIDTAVLGRADVILASDRLTYHWLKTQSLSWHTRIFCGASEHLTEPLSHTVALRQYERRLAARDHLIAVKPRALARPNVKGRHILLVVQSWGDGGMEQVVLDLAIGLTEAGCRITIVAATGSLEKAHVALAHEPRIRAVALAGDPTALADYIRSESVAVVNFHHSTFGLEAISALPVRKIYTFHNSYLWFSQAQRDALRQALKLIDGTISVSREVATYAARWFDIDPSRSFVIPNGTRLDESPDPAVRGTSRTGKNPGRPYTFLHVGTFNRVKLQDRLIRSFARVYAKDLSARLTMVGMPTERAFYEEVVALQRKLELTDAVRIVPGASRSDVLGMMRSHDCFVLPSLVEGWSISLLEAAMVGMPAVVTDVGSARDLRGKGAAVRIIPSLGNAIDAIDDVRMWQIIGGESQTFEIDLATGLLEAIRDRHVQSAASTSSKENIRKDFSIDKMVADYLDCFSLILI